MDRIYPPGPYSHRRLCAGEEDAIDEVIPG
jgi:hypothetical protein